MKTLARRYVIASAGCALAALLGIARCGPPDGQPEAEEASAVIDEPPQRDSCAAVCGICKPCDTPCVRSRREITCRTYGQCVDLGPRDIDGDGVWNCQDNCPWTPNPSQANCDHDAFGDACDQDTYQYLAVSGPTICKIDSRVSADRLLHYVDETKYEDRSGCNGPCYWSQRPAAVPCSAGESAQACWTRNHMSGTPGTDRCHASCP